MRDRTAVEAGIHAVLVQDPLIVFAYLYGSFIRGDVFQDIDIGVYVADPDPNPYLLSADLKSRLSTHLRSRGIDLPADRFDIQYTLVEMAEAMANSLQHILAKDIGIYCRE